MSKRKMYKVDIKFGPGSYGSYWVTPDDLEAYEKSLSKQGYKVIGTSEVEVQEEDLKFAPNSERYDPKADLTPTERLISKA